MPGVGVKPLFGNLGAFVNGNLYMGLDGADIVIKLSESERAELLGQPVTGPIGPDERPMGGYLILPSTWQANSVAPWIDRGLAQAAIPPPKTAKRTTAP